MADIAEGRKELTPSHIGHIGILDGWRALSITLVLMGHWFPFPREWQINASLAASGMAMFFTLSGFLITSLLLKDGRVGPFLIRRLFRIVPLAWAAMTILVIANGASLETALSNYLFTANLPPAQLMDGGKPLWSLCVEVHFYLSVALLVAVLGQRGLYLLPFACVAITALRIHDGELSSIVTWHRVDEILAGACVALIVNHWRREDYASRISPWICVGLSILLIVVAHPETGPLQYFRPYVAAAAIGFSLYAAPKLMNDLFTSGPAKYIAQTSYAIYVAHGMLWATWLGGEEASKATRYALRPLLLAATLALAHISTFYFEARFTALGKKIASRFPKREELKAQ